MTKKEKIIAICFVVSFVMVIASCVFTLYENKPKNQQFRIETIFNQISRQLKLLQ